MLQFEELRQTLREKEPDLRELSDDLGLEQTREEIEKLEQQAAAPGFGMCRRIPRRCCSVRRP